MEHPAPNPDAQVEKEPDPPRIYVASLSDYTAGHLHGRWIDATQALDDVWDEINSLLSRSTQPNAEEFAIHDFQGFGAWQMSEFESIADVHKVAAAVREHGSAITHWVDYLGRPPAVALATFKDAFLGTWPDTEAYVDDLAESIGMEINVTPTSWTPYVRLDVAALARDMEFELFVCPSGDGDFHIFDPSAADHAPDVGPGVVNSTDAQKSQP